MPSKREGTERPEAEATEGRVRTGPAGRPDLPRLDEMRVRAYKIYLERGGQPGRELDDWLEAERQLKSDLS